MVWNELEKVCRYGYSQDTVWQDFIEASLNALLSLTHNLQFADIIERVKENTLTGIYEDRYMAIVRKYKENQSQPIEKRPADHFKTAWEVLCKETWEKKDDVLGELYMEYVSRGQHGQFFTPKHVSDLIAKIAGSEGKTVNDPACGAGRMLISAAKTNRDRFFVGVDLDPICAKMATLNMWLFDLNADIYHGDSLKMEMFTVWHIRQGGYLYEADCPPAEKIGQLELI